MTPDDSGLDSTKQSAAKPEKGLASPGVRGAERKDLESERVLVELADDTS